jgi:hypothetical protein
VQEEKNNCEFLHELNTDEKHVECGNETILLFFSQAAKAEVTTT